METVEKRGCRLMACTMLLNMTGCKKQEEKPKEPQTEQKTKQKDEKEAREQRGNDSGESKSADRSCRPVRDSHWKTFRIAVVVNNVEARMSAI